MRLKRQHPVYLTDRNGILARSIREVLWTCHKLWINNQWQCQKVQIFLITCKDSKACNIFTLTPRRTSLVRLDYILRAQAPFQPRQRNSRFCFSRSRIEIIQPFLVALLFNTFNIPACCIFILMCACIISYKFVTWFIKKTKHYGDLDSNYRNRFCAVKIYTLRQSCSHVCGKSGNGKFYINTSQGNWPVIVTSVRYNTEIRL